jgi:thioesterase domain-containing protein
MTFNDFIDELNQKEIEVSFSSGKLKYKGPEQNITPEVIENLKKYKKRLIKYFWPEELTNMMPINTEGNKTPVFIIHGDNANYILSDHLGSDQPIYGFFHPGSDGEEIRFKSVEGMAREYLDKLLYVCPSGPFYLIGFSFGGVLAFEMAVQLQKLGFKVPFLVLIDSISPLARETKKPQSSLIQTIRINTLRPIRIKFKRFRKVLICKMYILMHKPVPVERRKDYMYIKYMKLSGKYCPDKFDGDILLFRTSENPSSYLHLGWETLVNNVRMVEIEGKHLEVFIGKERSEILTSEIEKHLAQVRS